MGENSKSEVVDLRDKENEKIKLDGIELKVLYTPGHTDCSYSFLMKDRVFTGDTLLINGTGRTDFQNGDPSLLYKSLHNKILKLDDETIIYPAHDYNGLKSSSIKNEKNLNERLHMDESTFIDFMNNLKLENPKLMDVAIPLNLECGVIK